MKSAKTLPSPVEFVREDMYGKKMWRHVQYLAEEFWNRLRKEYLANIALRQRWHTLRRNLRVEDIVMMKEDDVNVTALGFNSLVFSFFVMFSGSHHVFKFLSCFSPAT